MRRLLTGRVLQLLCVAAALLGRVAPFSLLDVGSRRLASKEEKLHSLEPWTYRQHADIVIDSIARWSDLDMGACKARSGNVVLVELLDLCFLPDANALARLTTDFIIFGPFHDQHHANFGPFSELDALYGKDLLEAHLTLKLGRCANGGRSVGDILTLLDHARLQHWVVHQHSAVRHSKIRALPLGFGYSDVRMDKQWTSLYDYKNNLVEYLRESAHEPRSKLLLVTMQIHTNLFGSDGRDPRSEALRNLSAIPSLQPWAHNQHFRSTDEYWRAVRQHKFLLSPWGWGPDCFRHYEAVALGTIPIILSDYITDMAVEGLPVLRVNSWSELSLDMLNREYERIHSIKTWQMDRLMRDSHVPRLFHVVSDAHRVCPLN